MSGEEERWKTIKNFENYEISDKGKIRKRVSGKKNSPAGMEMKTQVNKKGYITIHLWNGEKQTGFFVSRLVCEHFNGPPPTEDHEAAHLDGKPGNNCKENLAWKTGVENAADKKLHGTCTGGKREDCKSLLTLTQEQEIKEVPKYRGVGKDLAEKYNVSQALISNIRNDKKRYQLYEKK